MTAAPTLLTNIRIPGCAEVQRLWLDAAGIVQSIEPMSQTFDRLPPPQLRMIDLQGDWLSLGGVDLQINGALGLAFPDVQGSDRDRLVAICRRLWEQGVDAFTPTLVTSSIAQLRQAIDAIADFMAQPLPPRHAKVLGLHLEGPCLAESKRGAHPQEHLQPLTVEVLSEICGDRLAQIRIVTLAPELDPTGEAIAWLRQQGVIVSLGHTQATAEQAQAAFEQGATMVTHAFNAMPPLHHRQPGLLGAALTTDTVAAGVIADGQHIDPIMLKLLLRAGEGDRRLFLVSDALAPLGLPDGRYPWDERQITVTNGTCRLDNGTLAGTTLPLLAGVQNLVRWQICTPETAIALATLAPLRALGVDWSDPRLLYLSRPVCQLLRWQQSETGELTWQRLCENDELPAPASI
ncbi:N-acetylglucosamine-6-phosphate deacetylase [Synechococcus elongatus IITB4]|uniref:N-acetylglucosamine-6-phosphate deacetylase n=1 Tax=Synechococcus elongatus TaxID=32046 RepID=UPI0030CEB904